MWWHGIYTIQECNKNLHGTFECSNSNVAGVMCNDGTVPGVSCTQIARLKHNMICTACSNGDVRLIGGAVESEGTVEVCSSSVWGVVLSTGWTIRDANVVCKQLGYPSGGLSLNYTVQ